MSMVAERPMAKRPTLNQLQRAISEAAAARAVDDIILAMSRAGLVPRKAKAIGAAAQEFLVASPGFEGRARAILSQTGFSSTDIDKLVAELRHLDSSARAA